MLALSEITSACESRGSIRAVYLLDPDAVTTAPIYWLSGVVGNVLASTSAVQVEFTKGTAEYECKSAQSDDGRSYISELMVSVSGGQIAVDAMIRELMDHEVHAFFTDNHGTTRYMANGRLRTEYDIPAQIGRRQGYKITITLTDIRPAPVYAGTIP